MLNERIKKLRIRDGFTQAELAAKLDLTPKAVSFFELGERTPQISTIHELAEIFHVSTDYISGKTQLSTCDTCRFAFDPLDDRDVSIHEKNHKKYIDAVKKYGEIRSFDEVNNIKNDRIFKYLNKSLPIDKLLQNFEEYIRAAFELDIIQNGYDLNHIDFETYRIEAVWTTFDNMKEEHEEFIQALQAKYPKPENLRRLTGATPAEIMRIYDNLPSSLKRQAVKVLMEFENGNKSFSQLLNYIELLNSRGVEEAVGRVEELTELDRYKNKDYLEAVAAHNDDDSEGQIEKTREDSEQ